MLAPQNNHTLILFKVTIHVQDLGTRYAVFLQGEKEDIRRCYYAFYNHEATGGELEWESDIFGVLWVFGDAKETAQNKFKRAMAKIALSEILWRKHTKGKDPWPDALQMAEDRIKQINFVHWYAAPNIWDFYDIGKTVSAEKPTGNFDDDVLGGTLEREGARTDWQRTREAILNTASESELEESD